MTAVPQPPRHLQPSKLKAAPAIGTGAPEQLLLVVKPGYCHRCGVIRLSSANVNICDACNDEMARKLPARMPNVCRCGRGPVQTRGVCLACNREYAREQRARQRAEREAAP